MEQDKKSTFYPPSAPPLEANPSLRMPEPPPSYSNINYQHGAHAGAPEAPPPYCSFPQPGPQGSQYPAYPRGPYNVPQRQPSPQYGYPSMGPQGPYPQPGPSPQLGPYPQTGPYPPPGLATTVIHMPVEGQFDAGARFHPMAPRSIPPPPPGCIPNSAQVSVMQGHPTPHVRQKKGGFWNGSGGGGFTFW